MAKLTALAHDDTTTEPVEWSLAVSLMAIGGAHPPAGVPDDYGPVDWGGAEAADGPYVIFWNFGLQPG